MRPQKHHNPSRPEQNCFAVRLKNAFEASLYPFDFVAAYHFRSDGPGRGFCSARTDKKKRTKMFQKAEKVFKEKA